MNDATVPASVRTHADLIDFARMLNRLAGPITLLFQDAAGTWWRVWPRA